MELHCLICVSICHLNVIGFGNKKYLKITLLPFTSEDKFPKYYFIVRFCFVQIKMEE